MLFLVGLTLALVALALLLYLSRLLWGAGGRPLRNALEGGRMRRYEQRLTRGDVELRGGRLSPALAVFEGALYPFPASSAAFASAVQRHHVGLLSRFIAAADEVQGERVRLISLAKVDRLFHQRRALQDRYLSILQQGERRRRSEVEGEFRDNTRALREALHALAAEVEKAQRVRLH